MRLLIVLLSCSLCYCSSIQASENDHYLSRKVDRFNRNIPTKAFNKASMFAIDKVATSTINKGILDSSSDDIPSPLSRPSFSFSSSSSDEESDPNYYQGSAASVNVVSHEPLQRQEGILHSFREAVSNVMSSSANNGAFTKTPMPTTPMPTMPMPPITWMTRFNLF